MAADPIAYSPYVYIDEPKFDAAVSVEMDIILEDTGDRRRELHDGGPDERPLPLVAALKQDLAWLASSGSRRVKPDDVMVSVSMDVYLPVSRPFVDGESDGDHPGHAFGASREDGQRGTRRLGRRA